jgi:hypothetical protein
MATISTITITTPEVNSSEFKDLSKELLAELVSDDTSAFKDMRFNLEEYLDAATELDATQKAGIFADFLKDSYNTINAQAMQNAFNVLKANADYELAKYATETQVNTGAQNLAKIEAETRLLEKQILAQDNALELQVADKALKEAQLTELRAKLKKQYGVTEVIDSVLGDGTSDYKQYTDGVWYKVNEDGSFVNVDGEVINDPSVEDGIVAVMSTLSVSSTLENTTRPGSIDKQIRGYDIVNYKDVLKTLDERAALMQNAKVPETPGDKYLRKELLEAITGATITVDVTDSVTEGDILSVSDIVTP